MKLFKIVLLLLCFLLACTFIQANEIKISKTQQDISFSFSNTGSSFDLNNSMQKFAAHRGGGSQGMWFIVGGVMFTIVGVTGAAVGIAMTYINADGVNAFGFDDKTFHVEYWDKQKSTGWVLWGLGIGFSIVGSILFVAGVAFLIAGAISLVSGRHAKVFIDSDPKLENTSVGVSIKL
jgi:hypothetical protein